MGEVLILSIIYIINSILYLGIFYLMISKLTDRKHLIKKWEYILVSILIILILLFPKIEFIKIEYCIFQGAMLALLCKNLFKISIKNSLIYGIVFSFGYIILENVVSFYC